MAGRGAPPKREGQKVRRNKDPIPAKNLVPVPFEPPQLPDTFPWPQRTLDWWQMWRDCPQAAHFTVTDWDFLLDTALLHADVWGNFNLDRLPELRLRVAKVGATSEDRDRLRMRFVDDELSDRRDTKPSSSARARGRRMKIVAPDAV